MITQERKDFILSKIRGNSPNAKLSLWSKAEKNDLIRDFSDRRFSKGDSEFLTSILFELPDGETGDDILAGMNSRLPSHVRVTSRLNTSNKRVVPLKLFVDQETYPIGDLLETIKVREKRPNEFPPDEEL